MSIRKLFQDAQRVEDASKNGQSGRWLWDYDNEVAIEAKDEIIHLINRATEALNSSFEKNFSLLKSCVHEWEHYCGIMSEDWTCKKCSKRVTSKPEGLK